MRPRGWVRLVAVLCASGAGAAHAATVHVPGPGITSIQDGINAAIAGDEVVVAAGTWSGPINLGGKAITLRSADGAATTFISSTVAATGGETISTVVEGFTFNGFGPGVSTTSDLLIRHCTFADPAASPGTSVSVQAGGAPTFESCTFTSTHAFVAGGACLIANAGATFIDCHFDGSNAPLGGGIFGDTATLHFTNCTFDMCSADASGGAIYASGGSVTMTDCMFDTNSADLGGALYAADALITCTGTTFTENTATTAGGAARLIDADGALFEDVDFLDNDATNGGAVAAIDGVDGAVFRACVFEGNTATTGACFDMNPVTGAILIASCELTEATAETAPAIRMISGVLTIRDTTIDDCTAMSDPGAIQISGVTSHLIMANVHCESNDEGVLHLADLGSAHIVHCDFMDNAGDVVTMTGFDATIAGCVFAENDATTGTINTSGGSVSILNCTLWDNDHDAGGHAITGDAMTTISNSILWSNTADDARTTASAAVTMRSSCVEGGWAGVGAFNFAQDPQLANPAAGDYRIATCSPCRDAGDASVLPLDVADADGDDDMSEPLPFDRQSSPRIQDGGVDVGAYEMRAPMSVNVPGFAPSIQAAIDHASMLPGDEIVLNAAVYNEAFTMLGRGVRVRGQGATTILDGTGLASRPVTIDDGAWGCAEVTDLVIRNGSDTFGGGVAIDGGARLTLRNVTIESCDAGVGGGISVGDGMLRTESCIIASNTGASLGGGIIVAEEGDASIINTTIRDHDVTNFGGGVWSAGQMQLVNCLLIRNTAGLFGGHIMRAAGDADVINATMVHGQALLGGGVYNGVPGMEVVNTVLVWNTDSTGDGAAAQAAGAMADISYSLVQGVLPTGSVFAGDAGFLDAESDDYTPGPDSVLIDAGDTSKYPAGITLDLAGHVRVVDVAALLDSGVPDAMGRVIDIGALEAPGTTTPKPCPGDTNGDNMVNFSDLDTLLSQWTPPGPEADFDDSGVVDFADLNLLLDRWGTNCP